MTASVTFSPRYASAASFSLPRTMAEISCGEYAFPPASTLISWPVPLVLYATRRVSSSTSSGRRPMKRLME